MPVSIGEWRVRIGRFVNSASEYYITERKEKLLKERIRRLKLLIKRLLEKKENSEDKVDLDPNESSIINNDTPTDSHKEDTCSRSESTIEENTTQTESTTNHNSNGDDFKFPFFFTLLLSFFFLSFSLILFFVVDFFNLLGSFEPFLNWGGESTWRSTCFRIFVGSGLAKTVFSYVINTNEDVQDNLVLIGDENAKVKCIIKANKTSIESTNKANSTTTGTTCTIKSNNSPTESNIKENNTRTESVIGKNCTLTDSRNKETDITTESNKECNYIPTNATIKVSNAPSTNRDGPSEIIQSKTKTSKGKIIIEKNTTTELTIRENSTLPESTTKDDIAPKKCHIDTSSTTTDKPSRTKTSKRKTLISKRKNNKEKKTATVFTYNSNNTMTESTIKGNDSPTDSNINKDNNTQIKSSIKENNSLTESIIKDNNTPNGSAIKDNTKTESIFRNSNTLSTIKDKSSKRNIAKDKSIATESRIKENTTTTGSTIKGKSASTESAIKYNITSTESTTKDKNTPTKSTIKVNNASSESTIKKKNTPTESTIKVHNTTAERTINRNETTTELTIKDRNSTTEPTIKDTKTQIEPTIKDYKTRIELSIKYNTSTIQCTINENNTPTEPPIKGNNSTSESTIRYSDTSNKSVLKEGNTLSRTPIEDNNTQPMKAKTQAKYPIRSGTQKVLSYGKHYISSQILSSLKGTTDDPVMQESTCLPEMNLVKAGDVELNPGPCDRSGNIQEQELFNLAYNVPSSKYTQLCIELGISYNQSQTILDRRHWDFTESLMQIFCQWKDRQRHGTDCRQVIAAVLRGVNLDALGDKISRGDYIPQEAAPTASIANKQDPLTTEQDTRCGDDKSQPLTQEQIERCAMDFKRFYRTELCKIKTYPLDFSLVLEFERIYTDLVLLTNEQGTPKKIPLDYKKLLKTKVNGELPKRLMVEGEGGAGKTTFCSKMAWDWTNGADEFRDFVWVLVIPLRDIERNQTVGNIAKTYLSDSNSVHPHQIDEYILSNPSKVFIIFDGLDEYDGDLVKQGNDIAKIIRSEKFRECRVLVTTRPWKADQIKSNTIFMRTYAFIAVAGFDKIHISIYINKYFADDSQASRDLIKFIEDNDVIQENMAPFPIYIAMLCTLWRDSDSKKRELNRRLKTFSQLFQEILIFLEGHYVSRQFRDLDMEAVTEFYEQLSLFYQQIGEIALSGVVDKKLGYVKNDFSSCKEAMETCCRVGVLSKENRLVPRHDRRENMTLLVTVNVFFPHKLFQEYFAGTYLASLFESDPEQYKRAISDVLSRAGEFRYLLYFTASQSKNVAIDVTNRLINMGYQRMERHILVDIAFEAYDEDSAKMVGQHLFAGQKTLEIDDNMSAHTVPGYLFIMENITMETLILSRISSGPTISRDLSDVICSSRTLQALQLNGTALHDDFYGTLESKVKTSKLERLSIVRMQISDEHASRNLARFLNNLPRLKVLTLHDSRFDGRFYTELASGACFVEVERLSILRMKISDEHASRNLARFLNNLPRLKDLTLQDNCFSRQFYTELASGACSVEVGASRHSVRILHLDHRFHNDIQQHGSTVERLFPKWEHLYFTTLQAVSRLCMDGIESNHDMTLLQLNDPKDDPIITHPSTSTSSSYNPSTTSLQPSKPSTSLSHRSQASTSSSNTHTPLPTESTKRPRTSTPPLAAQASTSSLQPSRHLFQASTSSSNTHTPLPTDRTKRPRTRTPSPAPNPSISLDASLLEFAQKEHDLKIQHLNREHEKRMEIMELEQRFHSKKLELLEL